MGTIGPTASLEVIDDDSAVAADINRRFARYNRRFTDWGGATFSVIRRENGRVIAAARGATNMGLVEIRGVWVDENQRRQGLGRAVMQAIEAEARHRGCARATLDTYSWQARGFYERLGYTEFGRLDYPNGTHRIYMVKDLA